MNAAHLHLLINHLPIIGAALAVPLLLLALLDRRQSAGLAAATLVLASSAGGAVGALLTGEPAEEVVEGRDGVSEPWIEEHEERAQLAVVLALATALGSLAALGWAWRNEEVPLAGTAAVLGGAALTAGAMGWTGLAGGQIRHDEIRGDASGLVMDVRGEEDEDD